MNPRHLKQLLCLVLLGLGLSGCMDIFTPAVWPDEETIVLEAEIDVEAYARVIGVFDDAVIETGTMTATSRYGHPHQFMQLVDALHQAGIGVILDWVPGHFCRDDPGLRLFDGGCCYEYASLARQDNPGWGTSNFDLGKTEVQSFLISNALFWLDVFHIDGLRVDAVASMLYRDYGHEGGNWEPNQSGGRENLEGIAFLQKLNQVVFEHFPQALMMAEESTAWPLVSRPVDVGGLGFNYKWNMGWMNDVLEYMALEPIHRQYHHNLLTFSFMYAFSENFVLPFSHDEVVHGKRSLLDTMSGDYWQQFANLRALYGYMYAHPGKKLLFMGGEFGQYIEWNYQAGLDWLLLDYPMHKQLQQYVAALNRFYQDQPPLWEVDYDWKGFSWIDPDNREQSILSFVRFDAEGRLLVCLLNFTPVVRHDFRIGVPGRGTYREVFNSDDPAYGGSGQKTAGAVYAQEQPCHNQPYSIAVTVPPLAAVFFSPASAGVPEGEA